VIKNIRIQRLLWRTFSHCFSRIQGTREMQ